MEDIKDMVKLHLGCGKRSIPGFVHVDKVKFDHIDYVHDIRTLPMFKDETVSLIYACQVLEYFDRNESIKVLKEWKRVLCKGGLLRLSVPNFKTICSLYSAGVDLEFFIGTLYGKISDGNNGYIYHRTTFDEKTLNKLLIDTGYRDPKLWDWRKTEHSEIDDFSQAYFPHMDKEKGLLFNLNIEALK